MFENIYDHISSISFIQIIWCIFMYKSLEYILLEICYRVPFMRRHLIRSLLRILLNCIMREGRGGTISLKNGELDIKEE